MRRNQISQITIPATIAVLCASLFASFAFASIGRAPSGNAFLELPNPLVLEAKSKKGGKGHGKGSGQGKNHNKHWNGHPGKYKGGYVRNWSRKPYYGDVLAGVVLGTILGVAVAGAAPQSPSSDLCWYWTDPSRTRGYWDYCS
jgi:hypothetical protein